MLAKHNEDLQVAHIVHRKISSSSSAAIAQLLNMTKQPSLTSLIDLGLIYGPLGESIFDNNNKQVASSSSLPPASQANEEPIMGQKLIIAERHPPGEQKNISNVMKDESATTSQSQAAASVAAPEIKLIEKSIERIDENERTSEEMSAAEANVGEVSNASTATTTLKAPKLLRNEASISSLSSFFMNNQLKTLNFFYYPSLITKSKWTQQLSLSEAPRKSIEIDEKLDERKVHDHIFLQL